MILEVKEYIQNVSLDETVIAIDVRLSGIQGPQGIRGIDGVPGIGLPASGNTGDVLTKASNNDYETTWENIGNRYYTKQEIESMYGPVMSSPNTILLTQENIDTKQVTLPFSTVNPTALKLIPEGGIPQVYGVDFEIVGGNVLTWENLGLDNFLEANELLIIQH